VIHNSFEAIFKWPPNNVQINSWFTASYTYEIHKKAQTASGNMLRILK